MKDNIIEGNKIIAYSDFATHSTRATIKHYEESGNEIGLADYLSNLKYHNDWNLLMPVVEKIKNISIEQFYEKKRVMNALYDVDINILWIAVANFIKWYNKEQNAAVSDTKIINNE